MGKKKSKIEIAIGEALVDKPVSVIAKDVDYYSPSDVLKHYIRKNYWKKRIQKLKRDVNPGLQDGVKYFSFCSKFALDTRYFIQNTLIDLKQVTPFAFVEYVKDDYDFLQRQFISKPKYNKPKGFYGSFDEIATNSMNTNYGSFWATFPYDIINLDYLGDIHRTNPSKIGVNDFFAIQAIVNKQVFLRRPYELWITMRVKSGRIESAVKSAFRKIITHNIKEFQDTFGNKFNEIFPGKTVTSITDDELFLLGYLKWLFYVCRQSNSTIQSDELQILKYRRTDKDDKEYMLYNLFIRIKPFEHFVIPSPASEATEFCEQEYTIGIVNCFQKAIDISEEFEKLDDATLDELKKELAILYNEYKEDAEGWIN